MERRRCARALPPGTLLAGITIDSGQRRALIPIDSDLSYKGRRWKRENRSPGAVGSVSAATTAALHLRYTRFENPAACFPHLSEVPTYSCGRVLREFKEA
jgi:hypothetical protein